MVITGINQSFSWISHQDPEKPSGCELITKWRLPLHQHSPVEFNSQVASHILILLVMSYFSGILLHQEVESKPNIWYSNDGNLNFNQCYQLCLTGCSSLFKSFFKRHLKYDVAETAVRKAISGKKIWKKKKWVRESIQVRWIAINHVPIQRNCMPPILLLCHRFRVAGSDQFRPHRGRRACLHKIKE